MEATFLKAWTFSSNLVNTSETKFSACKPKTLHSNCQELLLFHAFLVQFWRKRERERVRHIEAKVKSMASKNAPILS